MTPIERGLSATISPHLSVKEFLRSSRFPHLVAENAVLWTAAPQIRANALRLAVDVFEPVRALVGPLQVTSGLRCPALNAAVGGSGTLPGQKPSAHMEGRAIDVIPMDMDVLDAMKRIARSAIEFDRVILERKTWIHLQVPRHAEVAKRRSLMWFGGAEYPPFRASDPRLKETVTA